MAYLRRYSPATDKRGFYIDGQGWTLQTSHRADRFLRKSSHYHDDTKIPHTVTKTLVHLNDAETGSRHSKQEILGWLPRLNADFCEMDSKQLKELRTFASDRVDDGALGKKELADFNEFLRDQTPLDPFL